MDLQIYSAAVYSNSYMDGMNRYVKLTDREREIVNSLPHILESFHYVGKQSFVDHMRNNGAKIFLDSGAFSAFTLGVSLSVSDYCDYIKRNMDIIRVEDGALMASVLDGIGDPLQTWRNQLEMEARGVRPLPCFHAGEDERYLEHYVRNYEYITLGGMVGSSTKQLMIWLDRMFDRFLTDGSGRPRCKVHGFGITSIPIMEEYPWYSCDSSSWIQSAAFGSIIVPNVTSKGSMPIAVSDKSPSRHDAGQHLCNLTPPEQDYIFTLLEQQGFTYDRLATIYESRAAYNLWAFTVINETINAMKAKRTDKKSRIQDLF
jgi:hypothetical protein